MTIKEVEVKTGLARSNIRFYEKEKLISPIRNDGNGYREYSEADVEDIKRIAYLRTLGISIEDIRRVMRGEAELYPIVKHQKNVLENQITDLENAKISCEKMLQSKKLNYQDLQVEQYVPTGLPEYWKKNRNIFKLDSVGFLYLWGGTSIWISIVIASLVTAVASFSSLPPQIPVQWSDNSVVNLAGREFIFAYPAACFLCRILLRPSVEGWLRKRIFVLYSTQIADYLTNFLCFVLLSIELFTLLFVKGILENIVIVLAVDSTVLIGLLLIGYHKLTKAA